MSEADIQPSLTAASAAEPQTEGLRPGVFFVTVLLIFVADQLSKAWMVNRMMLNDPRPIIGQAFRLTLTHNTGGAWGYMPRGNNLFAAFAAVAIVALILAYQRVGRQDIQVGAAFALAMGGAIGNVLDRIRLGYVVDFFDAHIIHWPVFNIADSAITVSILLLVWHFVRPRSPRFAEAAH
jgi:signal peptidase II